jgi:hypothetical protein
MLVWQVTVLTGVALAVHKPSTQPVSVVWQRAAVATV